MKPGRGTGSPKRTVPAQDCTQGSDRMEEEDEEEEEGLREADWKNKWRAFVEGRGGWYVGP